MGGPRPRYDRLGSLLEALHSKWSSPKLQSFSKSAQLTRTVQYNYGLLITRKSPTSHKTRS